MQFYLRARGFQEVEAPRFRDNGHKKVTSLSALRTGSFTPKEKFLVLISVRGWFVPAGRIISMKNSIGTIVNRTPVISACSALPQTIAPPGAPTTPTARSILLLLPNFFLALLKTARSTRSWRATCYPRHRIFLPTWTFEMKKKMVFYSSPGKLELNAEKMPSVF